MRDGVENSRYALLCTAETGQSGPVWAPGTYALTAWNDAGVFPYPIACGADGYLVYTEKGDSANGAPFSWHITTGDISIRTGDTIGLVRTFYPDFKTLSGGAQLYAMTQNYNQSPVVTHGPFNITSAIEKVDLMGDAPLGRMVSFKLSGSSSPAQARTGQLQFDFVDTGMVF